MGEPWGPKERNSLPVVASHSRTLPSLPPQASDLLSALNVSPVRGPASRSWDQRSACPDGSRTCKVRSPAIQAQSRPSGLNATADEESWPVTENTVFRVATSQ